MKKLQYGAATLVITLALLTVSTILIIYAGSYGLLQDRAVANISRQAQAYQAAEAGLEFGVAYLATNGSTIISSPSGGFINYGSPDANITNVSLANGAKFSVVYTNPTANNYTLLNVTATGTNSDGTSTAVIKQQAYAGTSVLNSAMMTQGNIVASGNVTISGANGVDAGGTVTTAGNINISNIIQNDSPLKTEGSATLFQNIFGVSEAQMKTQATNYSSASLAQLGAMSGENWVNSSVVVSGNATVGSAANPVLIVINGSLIASGNMTIYGVVFVLGSTTMSGNVNFNGGIVSTGAITISGSTGAYSASAVNKYTSVTFSKIPGSWKDF